VRNDSKILTGDLMQEHTIQVRIQVANFKLGIIYSSQKKKKNFKSMTNIILIMLTTQ
jgi:hypothetical protein